MPQSDSIFVRVSGCNKVISESPGRSKREILTTSKIKNLFIKVTLTLSNNGVDKDFISV